MKFLNLPNTLFYHTFLPLILSLKSALSIFNFFFCPKLVSISTSRLAMPHSESYAAFIVTTRGRRLKNGKSRSSELTSKKMHIL